MSEVAYTGKCDNCGHAQSAHKSDRGCLTCIKQTSKFRCPGFIAQIDISKHNSLDGRAAVELYDFQIKYLADLPPKYIFAADTGTGKTFMSLAHYDKHAYLKPLLILAPAAKVSSGDWERDIQTYFAGRMVPEYAIFSYEKFSRMPSMAEFKKTGANGVWREWMRDHSDYAVIADECHKGKNAQSGNGKAMYNVARAASCFIGLSATPLPNGWQDAVNYFKIFGFVKNKTEFWKRYVHEDRKRGFPIIMGYFHEEELKDRWNSISKPLDKQQALDLPPVVSVPVSLESGPGYKKIMKERMVGEKFLDNPSALLHALRQAPVEPKVKWLEEFLEGASDNVVVFYNYKEERERILAMLKKSHKGRQIFRQDGEKHEIPNKEKWSSLFRTVTLAQYQSGSTGIELTYAATTVYFSPTYSYSNYEQSIGRTNRNGQTQKMTLYLLCAPTTVERDIWAALRNKSDFQEKQWYDNTLDKSESNVLHSASTATGIFGPDDIY